MQIRLAKPQEGALLSNLDQECFSSSWNDKDWKDFILAKQYDCFLSLEGNTPVGFLLTSYAADEGEIIKIGVLKEHRGKQYGKHLLDFAFKKWKELGVRFLFLEVRNSNFPARGLYQAQGFEKVGVRKNYYQNPKEDAIVYTCSL